MESKPFYNSSFYVLNIDNKKVLKKQLVDRCLYENPNSGMVLADTWKKLMDGYYNLEIVNSIFQYPEWSYPDLYDAYYFALTWAKIIDKDLYFLKIPLNEEPSSDKEVEDNNYKLETGLSRYYTLFTDERLRVYNKGLFKAQFKPEKGRGATSDGSFHWTKPLVVENEKCQDISKSKKVLIKIPPGKVPLEVGSTDSFTTFQHLEENGGVARWAYNSKDIILFINSNHEGFNFQKITIDQEFILEC